VLTGNLAGRSYESWCAGFGRLAEHGNGDASGRHGGMSDWDTEILVMRLKSRCYTRPLQALPPPITDTEQIGEVRRRVVDARGP
jgi:hypothetical protein